MHQNISTISNILTTVNLNFSEIEALYSIIVNLLVENRRLKRRNVKEDESNILMDLANGNGFGAQIRPG